MPWWRSPAAIARAEAGRRIWCSVVLSVEQVLVGPTPASSEAVAAGLGEVVVAEIAGELLARAERAEIPGLHLRVGSVVFHVHGVVLTAFHDRRRRRRPIRP